MEFKPETVYKHKLGEDTAFLRAGWVDDNQLVRVDVTATRPLYAHEDRNVRIRIGEEIYNVKAESAMELGELLIRQARKTMVANMMNHTHIHYTNLLKGFMEEDRVDYTILTLVDKHPLNYPTGWQIYRVEVKWKEGEMPKHFDDFYFDTVIRWSEDETEYLKQLEEWCNPEVIGYDRETDLLMRKEALKFN
jgi:hypothetical protein